MKKNKLKIINSFSALNNFIVIGKMPIKGKTTNDYIDLLAEVRVLLEELSVLVEKELEVKVH